MGGEGGRNLRNKRGSERIEKRTAGEEAEDNARGEE